MAKQGVLARFILQTSKYTSHPHKVGQRAREVAKNGIVVLFVIPAFLQNGK